MRALHRKRRINHTIHLEEEVIEEDVEEIIIEVEGEDITKEEYLNFIVYGATKLDVMLPHASSLGT